MTLNGLKYAIMIDDSVKLKEGYQTINLGRKDLKLIILITNRDTDIILYAQFQKNTKWELSVDLMLENTITNKSINAHFVPDFGFSCSYIAINQILENRQGTVNQNNDLSINLGLVELKWRVIDESQLFVGSNELKQTIFTFDEPATDKIRLMSESMIGGEQNYSIKYYVSENSNELSVTFEFKIQPNMNLVNISILSCRRYKAKIRIANVNQKDDEKSFKEIKYLSIYDDTITITVNDIEKDSQYNIYGMLLDYYQVSDSLNYQTKSINLNNKAITVDGKAVNLNLVEIEDNEIIASSFDGVNIPLKYSTEMLSTLDVVVQVSYDNTFESQYSDYIINKMNAPMLLYFKFIFMNDYAIEKKMLGFVSRTHPFSFIIKFSELSIFSDKDNIDVLYTFKSGYEYLYRLMYKNHLSGYANFSLFLQVITDLIAKYNICPYESFKLKDYEQLLSRLTSYSIDVIKIKKKLISLQNFFEIKSKDGVDLKSGNAKEILNLVFKDNVEYHIFDNKKQDLENNLRTYVNHEIVITNIFNQTENNFAKIECPPNFFLFAGYVNGKIIIVDDYTKYSVFESYNSEIDNYLIYVKEKDGPLKLSESFFTIDPKAYYFSEKAPMIPIRYPFYPMVKEGSYDRTKFSIVIYSTTNEETFDESNQSLKYSSSQSIKDIGSFINENVLIPTERHTNTIKKHNIFYALPKSKGQTYFFFLKVYFDFKEKGTQLISVLYNKDDDRFCQPYNWTEKEIEEYATRSLPKKLTSNYKLDANVIKFGNKYPVKPLSVFNKIESLECFEYAIIYEEKQTPKIEAPNTTEAEKSENNKVQGKTNDEKKDKRKENESKQKPNKTNKHGNQGRITNTNIPRSKRK